MAIMYGRAGRLTAKNGVFWPGQYASLYLPLALALALQTVCTCRHSRKAQHQELLHYGAQARSSGRRCRGCRRKRRAYVVEPLESGFGKEESDLLAKEADAAAEAEAAAEAPAVDGRGAAWRWHLSPRASLSFSTNLH